FRASSASASTRRLKLSQVSSRLRYNSLEDRSISGAGCAATAAIATPALLADASSIVTPHFANSFAADCSAPPTGSALSCEARKATPARGPGLLTHRCFHDVRSELNAEFST